MTILLIATLLSAQLQADLQSAIKELQETIRLNGTDAEAHGRLGLLYRKMGRSADAVKSLERAVELRPEPRLQVLLAFSYMDAGHYHNAAPLLAKSFELEEKDSVKSVVGQRLVECFLAAGEEEQALPYIQKLRQIAPHDPNVLYLSSKVYMNLWNGAFQLMLAKAPDSYHVALIQAEALEAQGRFGEAAGEYRKVLKIDPKLGDIHYRLGRAVSRNQGDEREAQAEFRKELEINPSHVGALTEVAKVLIAEKQWSKALGHLEIAARLAPNEEAVHYNLMLAYRGLGRADQAKQAFTTFQRLKEQKKK